MCVWQVEQGRVHALRSLYPYGSPEQRNIDRLATLLYGAEP
jgi:hypothetical protein